MYHIPRLSHRLGTGSQLSCSHLRLFHLSNSSARTARLSLGVSRLSTCRLLKSSFFPHISPTNLSARIWITSRHCSAMAATLSTDIPSPTSLPPADLTVPATSPVPEELDFVLPAVEHPVPAASSAPLELDFVLPERPMPLEDLAVIGELPFDTLGLATWWPSGRVQLFMEWLHVDLGLEWWQTIMLTTVCMRLLVFPVVVMAQRNLANMANNGPAMARLQDKMSTARRRGDMLESAQLGHELQVFMKKQGMNPLKNMIPVGFQFPIFLSMFFGLRGMAYCPVDSMKEGGLAWFTNLTISDPYMILPILTSTTLYLQLKMGSDGAKLDQFGPKMQIALTAMPLFMLLVTYNFPSAICLYWCTTNIISLGQARLLKVPTLRTTLNIPELVKQEATQASPVKKKKSFIEGMRESVDNMDFMQQWTASREFGREYDEKQFKAAGTKSVKTFKYDPTKPVQIDFKDGKRFQ